MKWTMFKSASAMQALPIEQSWGGLLEHLRDAGTYRSKDECPWVKLAIFGNLRTAKHSLRHDANVLAITGVEGDYDGEKMTMEEAIAKLEAHGVRAIVYTSPSHGVVNPPKSHGGPRWRVLAPCSKEHLPGARSALLARLNGALGGVLADESFTLSQSYYFGRVQGVEYRVMATFDDPDEGWCIDDLDDLDNIAISKKGRRHRNDDLADDAVKTEYSLAMFEAKVAALGRKLKTGDGRRELLKSYIASRSNRGLLRDELLTMIEGVVGKYFDPADPIDQANVIGIIDSFVQKDKHKADQPADITAVTGSKLKKEKAAKTGASRRIEYPPPYPGVMSEIVEAANRSAYKPQPHLNLLGALIGMAACINGEYSTRSGGRFNVYGIGALESGGGKDNPRMVAETVAAMGHATILGKPGSGAGLEDALEARRNQLVAMDEVAHMLQAMNDERAASHIKDIGAVTLKLYSASRGAYNKRILAKGPGRANEVPTIANPCVSMIGFATPEGLGEAFNETNFTDGLMARNLFVRGDPEVKVRRPQFGFELPASIETVLKNFAPVSALSFIGPIASVGSRIVGEPGHIGSVMDRLLEEMETKRDMTFAVSKSLYARTFEKLERVAGVLAIWENPLSPVLRMDHVDWARQFVMASDAAMLDFVSGYMHSNEVTKFACRLRGLIRRILAGEFSYQRPFERACVEEAGCVARSQLLRVSKMDKAAFDRTLAHMQDLGELSAFDERNKGSAMLTGIELLED